MLFRYFRTGLLAAVGAAALIAQSAPARADVEHTSLAVPATVVCFCPNMLPRISTSGSSNSST